MFAPRLQRNLQSSPLLLSLDYPLCNTSFHKVQLHYIAAVQRLQSVHQLIRSVLYTLLFNGESWNMQPTFIVWVHSNVTCGIPYYGQDYF